MLQRTPSLYFQFRADQYRPCSDSIKCCVTAHALKMQVSPSTCLDPIPVPLAALQAAGLMPMQPPCRTQSQQRQAAAATVTAAEDDEAVMQPEPHALCTEGRVSEGSRRAAMACGISAAAAGSGAVPDLSFGAAALAGDAAAAAVAKQVASSSRRHGSGKHLQLVQAAAKAAATAAVTAVQQAEASQQRRALPPFGDIKSVVMLWELWKDGSSSSLSWEAQEAQGTEWRMGKERKRFCELLIMDVIKEVQRLAAEKKIQPKAAAAIMDAERGSSSSMPANIKTVLPEKLRARAALRSAAAPAADVQATTAAVAAAAQAAAAAAAAAADVAAHQAAAAVASRRR